MNYNTSREKLVIKEYGRNIQSLIQYATTVEDREQRSQLAEFIVEMMSQLNPQMRNVDDFKRKLWDHLYLISDFKLEVDSPFPMPEPGSAILPAHVDRMEYPRDKIKYKHYGKNVETMINRASEMEDPEMQKDFVEVIANYMKMVYNTWNRDNINDEIIKNDLESLSNGKLSVPDDSNLDTLRNSNRKKTRPVTSAKSKYSSNRRGSNRGGDRDNNKRRNYKN